MNINYKYRIKASFYVNVESEELYAAAVKHANDEYREQNAASRRI